MMRTVLKIAIAFVALAAMSWIGVFFYWHLRVGREIRILRTQTTTRIEDLTQEQRYATVQLGVLGCRALPRLIGALHPSEEAGFLNAASHIVASEAWYIDHREHDDLSEPFSARMVLWQILPQDSDAVKRRKTELMWAWWRGHAPRHPWWRVWSEACLRPAR